MPLIIIKDRLLKWKAFCTGPQGAAPQLPPHHPYPHPNPTPTLTFPLTEAQAASVHAVGLGSKYCWVLGPSSSHRTALCRMEWSLGLGSVLWLQKDPTF